MNLNAPELPKKRVARWHWLGYAMVFLLALLIRLNYVTTADVTYPIRADAAQYYSYAWNMLNHGVFSKALPDAASVIPDNYRTPGYPAFLTAAFAITGGSDDWYVFVLVTQCLLGAASVALVMLLGRRWLSPSWALVAGLLAAAWPLSVTLCGYILTETLFGFLMLLGLFLTDQANRSGKIWAYSIAGLIFGAAAMVNPVLTPLPLILAVLGLAGNWRRALVFVVAAMLMPLGWSIRNASVVSVNGDFNATATHRLLENVIVGSWPDFSEAYQISYKTSKGDPEAEQVLRNVESDMGVAERDLPAAVAKVAARMGNQPLRYLYWYGIRKPVEVWGWPTGMAMGDIYVYPVTNSPYANNLFYVAMVAICHALNGPIEICMALTLCGLLIAGRRSIPRQVTLLSTCVVAVYVTLTFTLLYPDARYTAPFRGLGMLLAVTFLAWLAELMRDLRARAALQSA